MGADVLDLAETMVASADGLIYEPVSVFCHAGLACCLVPLFLPQLGCVEPPRVLSDLGVRSAVLTAGIT